MTDQPGAGPDVTASAGDVASQSSGSASAGDGSGHVLTHHARVAIRRSPDDVTRYVFDPTTMPHWSAVLYEIEPVTDVEPRRGRRMRANLKILGVCLTVEGELTDVDPEARQATVHIVPAGGDGSLEHRLAVEASEDGAVVHFWNRVEVPTWLSSTVSDEVIRRFLDHTATFALANIRDILEHHQEEGIRRLGRRASGELPPPARLGDG